jgi:hypothetical protein
MRVHASLELSLELFFLKIELNIDSQLVDVNPMTT